VLVQTRLPDHDVLAAAVHADPPRLVAAEAEVRAALRFPPSVAIARVSGPAARALIDEVDRMTVDISDPVDGRYLVRAADPKVLADALGVPRPPGKLRVEVDPRL
jgi:hypothetical protein